VQNINGWGQNIYFNFLIIIHFKSGLSGVFAGFVQNMEEKV